MSENQNTINSAEQFQQITDKRVALESLINIASGIHHQQQALNELAIAARPSQDFPKKIVNYFKQIKKHLSQDATPDIVKKLDAIDLITQKTLSNILNLTSLDINRLRDDQLEDINVASFNKSIDDFKRRTQTSLALRYVLQQRGVVVAPFKLPIAQEEIYEQVEDLKTKEHECVEQIKVEIKSIIDDTGLLLKQDSFSDEMKADLINVNHAMLVNLEHLENGGLVTEIPNVFDIITLETEKPVVHLDLQTKENALNSKSEDDVAAEKSTKTLEAEKAQAAPFWWTFKKWLSSPWSTSWSSVKRRYQKKK